MYSFRVMVFKWLFLGALSVVFHDSMGQIATRDTIPIASEDTVYANSSSNPFAVAVSKTRAHQTASNKNSLLELFNSVPGIRMEERSPGSYRLNIRGSALRSPFGVRNVRIYWNDIPLTDPGGNTYFNQLAYNNFTSIIVEKASSSTLYGSGTGGQVIFENKLFPKNSINAEVSFGSYGLKSLLASANIVGKNMAGKLTYAHQDADGYRQQSAMRRDNISWQSQIKFSKKQQLLLGVLFSDMYYQTPGGLTWSEYQNNPRSARPAAGMFPSAMDAKAAIFQKNITVGATYLHQINKSFSQSTTLYGAYNRVENSAIRNFEKRKEPHYGGRSVWTFAQQYENGNRLTAKAGVEAQEGYFNIKVLGNKNGIADTLQTNDNIHTTTYSLFSQFSFDIAQKWNYTLSVSYNKSRIAFNRVSNVEVSQQPFSYSNEWAPRLGLQRRFGTVFSIAGFLSKGFSTPTIAELLPSTGILNTTLKAEKGWNYEMILSIFPKSGLSVEASLFRFLLKDAIVQRKDDAGADYFTNAGGTRQNGIEWSASYHYRLAGGFWKDGWVKTTYARNFFAYNNFIKEDVDFSGKVLPGVPSQTFSITTGNYFKGNAYSSLSYYAASAMFLDDANTVSTKPYHVLNLKLGKEWQINKWKWNLFIGADNLLNENYSLGNDINAVSGRFYNAAPRRNYYGGASIAF